MGDLHVNGHDTTNVSRCANSPFLVNSVMIDGSWVSLEDKQPLEAPCVSFMLQLEYAVGHDSW